MAGESAHMERQADEAEAHAARHQGTALGAQAQMAARHFRAMAQAERQRATEASYV